MEDAWLTCKYYIYINFLLLHALCLLLANLIRLRSIELRYWWSKMTGRGQTSKAVEGSALERQTQELAELRDIVRK